MNDRELLELAAKAAGIGLVGPTDKYIAQHDKGSAAFIIDNNKGGHSNWNPITDDGDAFRLAHKLGLLSDIEVWPRTLEETRRAIVSAAAEIGKSK